MMAVALNMNTSCNTPCVGHNYKPHLPALRPMRILRSQREHINRRVKISARLSDDGGPSKSCHGQGEHRTPSCNPVREQLAKLVVKAASLALVAGLSISFLFTSPLEVSAGLLPPSIDISSELLDSEKRTVSLFQDSTPSVVNITNVAALQDRFTLDITKIPQGTGSGFVWDQKGHVVTNFHVIKGASELRVTMLDQSVYTATVVGGDESKDVAVLELNCPSDVARKFRPVSIGSSASLLVGQQVFAIGNPFGLDHTLTQGIISGLGRELNTGLVPIKGVIQTDAAINPGNSGGVLLNSRGKLIGINTAILDPTGKGTSSGVGFAIPIDSVKGLVDQILKYGKVIRPALGVSIAPPQILSRLGIKGVLILEILPGTPAAEAGLLPTKKNSITGAYELGDIIVGIDGVAIRDYKELFQVLDSKKVGQRVKMQVLRDENIEEIFLTLAESLPEQADN